MSEPEINFAILAPEINDLALLAGRAILEIYATDFVVESKADSSPVTAADIAAEDIITQGLHLLTPNIPVVAEEAVAGGYVPDTSGGIFWLVDPLDGTREFLSRNGEFTVNIGLIKDGIPVLGVVHAPALNATYLGCAEFGATRTTGISPPQVIRARKIPADGLTVVSSRRHGDPSEIDRLLDGRSIAARKTVGSSIKFCTVAMGEADIYPRYGRTMEWDTAAGNAVLTAAGGRIVTTKNLPLTYGKPNFENPGFVAWGSVA